MHAPPARRGIMALVSQGNYLSYGSSVEIQGHAVAEASMGIARAPLHSHIVPSSINHLYLSYLSSGYEPG